MLVHLVAVAERDLERLGVGVVDSRADPPDPARQGGLQLAVERAAHALALVLASWTSDSYVEQGSHADLLERGGPFARLHAAQFAAAAV